MKLLLSFVLALGLACDSRGDDDVETKYHSYLAALLVASKFTGMCGALQQMGKFQDATQMQGGDEFISRFINTEAARLGLSIEDFFHRCDLSTKAYNEGLKSAQQG